MKVKELTETEQVLAVSLDIMVRVYEFLVKNKLLKEFVKEHPEMEPLVDFVESRYSELKGFNKKQYKLF